MDMVSTPIMYTPVLLTGNAAQQAALYNWVRTWIPSAPVGYEYGAQKRRWATTAKRWATVMIKQSGARVYPGAFSMIAAFNGGEGAAADFAAGRRSADDVRTLAVVPFGRFSMQQVIKVDFGNFGIAP